MGGFIQTVNIVTGSGDLRDIQWAGHVPEPDWIHGPYGRSVRMSSESELAIWHTPASQSGSAWGGAQRALHAPQWAGSASTSNSSSVRPSQSLSRSSHASSPPLVGLQAYSQPLSTTPSASA